MARLEWETGKIVRLRRMLMAWYERSHRDLPWRRNRDPYAIWVSEVMLQQTRVAVVEERFTAFLERFPTLDALARAPEQEVLALWSGLGYYRRARMLHKAAQFVVANCAGMLPQSSAELRLLPGIGAYTAAAVASIAFGECVAVVDGNVERVLYRLAGWETGVRAGSAALKRKVGELATGLMDTERPGDFNQALMELGATVCLPRNPLCLVCPLSTDCYTRGEHRRPPRPPMLSREVAHALALRTRREAGRGRARSVREVLLEQRPASAGVMPGMWELPLLREAAVPDKQLKMAVRHAIMQVNYYVRIRTVRENDVEALTVAAGARRWVPLTEAGAMALTGLARKVLTRARLLPLAAMDPAESVAQKPDGNAG
ncbi:MAG TPA: A/G-specific adenine glycosylase [Terracidiphilus sp.]|nr:A/G-specific adenine glycosylase [Terracidiphilus sp.]